MPDLAAFFHGANLGRARARRFGPFTWFAHSYQNIPSGLL